MSSTELLPALEAAWWASQAALSSKEVENSLKLLLSLKAISLLVPTLNYMFTFWMQNTATWF